MATTAKFVENWSGKNYIFYIFLLQLKWAAQKTIIQTADKQDSFVTGVLSAASAVHCGALWRTVMSLLVIHRGVSVPPFCTYMHHTYCRLYLWVSASYHTVPTSKVLTSDLLHFLRYRLTQQKRVVEMYAIWLIWPLYTFKFTCPSHLTFLQPQIFNHFNG